MKKTKKNNKGFSLVELIVVVLIMAIIAVALAPQVMKWVDNSKKATDVQNYDSLMANCQLALTDSNAYSFVTSGSTKGNYIVSIKPSGTTITKEGESSAIGTNTALYKALDNLDKSWSSLVPKVTTTGTETEYQIKITENGVVERVTGKTPDSNIS